MEWSEGELVYMKHAGKFLITAAVCLAAFVMLYSPCAAEEARYVKITAQEAKARIDSGRAAVLDVRTKEEYDERHIPCALLIPLDMLEKGAPRLLPDKDEEILVYCRSGRRSAEAAEKLAEMGYTRVFDFGGIIDWPYATERTPAL